MYEKVSDRMEKEKGKWRYIRANDIALQYPDISEDPDFNWHFFYAKRLNNFFNKSIAKILGESAMVSLKTFLNQQKMVE